MNIQKFEAWFEQEYKVKLSRKVLDSGEYDALLVATRKAWKAATVQAQLEADKWISVHDRLPKVGVPVLIHAPSLQTGAIVGIIDDAYVSGVWALPYSDDSMRFKYGKFWQPLPEPPAGKVTHE